MHRHCYNAFVNEYSLRCCLRFACGLRNGFTVAYDPLAAQRRLLSAHAHWGVTGVAGTRAQTQCALLIIFVRPKDKKGDHFRRRAAHTPTRPATAVIFVEYITGAQALKQNF